MLLHLCAGAGCLAILYALSVHLYNNRRTSAGAVLVAVMFALQTVFHPSAKHSVVLQLEDKAENEDSGDGDHPPSLEQQMRRHASRIRSGDTRTPLTFRLPAETSLGQNAVKPRNL